MDVVLFAPEIPQNTGSVARMCAGTGVGLHLVGPLGFSLEDRYLKRAGLDYWGDVCLGVHKDLEALLKRFAGRPVYFLSKKAERNYNEVTWTGEEVLVFGPESTGLPDWVLDRYRDQCLRIPVRSAIRSLNLSAAVHVVVYHALERLGFPGIS
jgi:tRNA (cytidine/uridine-2'-O-)-methyltransferase